MPLRPSAAAVAAVAATRHRRHRHCHRHRHLPSAIDAVRPWYPLNFLVSFYGSTIMEQRPLAGSTWFSDLSNVMRLLCGHLLKNWNGINWQVTPEAHTQTAFSAASSSPSSSSDYIVHIWISVARLFYYSFSDLLSHWNRFYVHSLKCRSYSLLTFYSFTTTTRTTTDHALH